MSFAFRIEQRNENESFSQQHSAAEKINTSVAHAPKKDISYAKLDFIMEDDGNKDIQGITFIPYAKEFTTRKNHQVIIIDTSKINKGVDPGRFKIRHVVAGYKGRIEVLHVFIESTASGLREVKLEELIQDEEVTMVVLEFRMPGHRKTDPFKFFLTVEDTSLKSGTTASTKNCDPQVGNDPSKAP